MFNKKEEFMSDNIMAYIKKSEDFASGKGSCDVSGVVMVCDQEEIYATASKMLEEDDPTAHAAAFAIRKTRLKKHAFLLNDCEIYSSEKPCNMCLLAIYQAGIKNVYYLEKEEINHMLLTAETLKKAYTVWEF